MRGEVACACLMKHGYVSCGFREQSWDFYSFLLRMIDTEDCRAQKYLFRARTNLVLDFAAFSVVYNVLV